MGKLVYEGQFRSRKTVSAMRWPGLEADCSEIVLRSTDHGNVPMVWTRHGYHPINPGDWIVNFGSEGKDVYSPTRFAIEFEAVK